jgi:hypothetical protein
MTVRKPQFNLSWQRKISAGNILRWLKIVYRNNTENKSIVSHWAKKVKV